MGDSMFEPINRDGFSVQITNPEVMKRLNIETPEETISRFTLGKSLKDIEMTVDLADPETSDYSTMQTFLSDWKNLVDYNRQDVMFSQNILLSHHPRRLPRIIKKAMKATYRRNTKGKRMLAKLRLRERYPSYILKDCKLVASPDTDMDGLMNTLYAMKFDYAEQV